MTIQDVLVIIEKQDGKCLICCGTFDLSDNKSYHVDHDHSCCSPGAPTCGECVRGILCMRCNQSLGVYEKWVVPFMSQIDTYLNGNNVII